MKYLKSYKIFESVSDVRNEIEDILTELFHLGYHIDIYSTSAREFDEIKIIIEKGDDQSTFLYTPDFEFVEVLQHLISYATEQSFHFGIFSSSNGTLIKKEKLEDLINQNTDYIKIILRK